MQQRPAILIGCLVLLAGSLLVSSGLAVAQADASIQYDGEALTLHPAAGQAITGTTDLEAGRSVTVRLQSTGDTSPLFIKSETASVGTDGTFRVTFDLSDVEPPGRATATVVADGEQLAGPVEVQIVQAPSEPSPAVETPGQPGFGVVAALAALVVVIVLGRR